MGGASSEEGEGLERAGEERYFAGDYAGAVARYEQAYAAYRRDGRVAAAGRAARTLGWISGGVFGDWAVESGWLARARSVLAEAGPDGPEHGWLLILRSFGEDDLRAREALLREAGEIGRRCRDPDVEFEALAYLGGLLILTDRPEQGLVHFDEAMAAACAGELADLAAIDSMFCGFFWACEVVHDVARAEQWMRAIAARMDRSAVVAAFCRAHYGGILTAAGRWDEAEAELLAASRQFDTRVTARREAAVVRLADLRVRQGRLEDAAELLRGLDRHPDAVRARAALHLARGETALARDLLERATGDGEGGDPVPAAPLLALLVEAELSEGRIDAAERAAARLARLAEARGGPYLLATAALARGRVCVAGGPGDARGCLEEALHGFARAQLPSELAQTRLELARALAGRLPQVAITEARAALADFERLPAARQADAAAALLRELGVPVRTGARGVGALTKRETEVLRLLGAGLSNPEIATRLFITRKTVETHVGNVLAKLGLRNRAEAAALATREEIRR
ncbi:MAG TPA: LuxR C-terminal-related transcriptional regulator [Mycobacteriales bacterium]